MLHVVDMRVQQDYRIWLRFSDGLEGVADLTHALDGPMFEPLRDRTLFGAARLDADLHTVAWPHGADLAPEYLHALVTGALQMDSTRS
ncbi:MAG: DUF2442 domain-containing protein [Gemmatimonas sp.]